MEKITIQHFVNKELNPRNENGLQKYPVYVQVIVLRKNLRFKSNNNFFEYLTEDDLQNEMVQNILENEKEIIEHVTRELIKQEKRVLITSKNLSLYTKNLNDTIDDNFGKFILKEVEDTNKFIPNLLIATYREVNEVIYFYNDNSPITAISENMYLCINAIDAIFEETSKRLFYVYDLFFGNKKNDIEDMINAVNGYDKEETKKMIDVLQKLTIL